ncbi:hypothetical protein [Aquipuribacter sp. MA13-6]|uniref:protein kinase family protein n=1 Tax=unclassified Aquipuribacter TaxID=2635084 RepID=UPI003EEEB3A3
MDRIGPGTLLAGRYRLAERTHDDGSGSAWRAEDVTLERPVAVTVLAAEHARVQSTLDAARRAALVDDRRLQRVLGVGLEGSSGYVVLEWVTGQDVAALAGTVSEQEAVRVVTEAAEALRTAATRSLHHGRLAPRHVVRASDGSVRVLGTAIDVAAAGQATPAAAARPEARDVRDLGAVLYALVSGRWPFGSVGGLEAAPTEKGRPVPVGQLRDDVSAPLGRLLEDTLAGSGAETLTALVDQLHGTRAAIQAAPGAAAAAAGVAGLAAGAGVAGAGPAGGRGGSTAPSGDDTDVLAPVPATASGAAPTSTPTPVPDPAPAPASTPAPAPAAHGAVSATGPAGAAGGGAPGASDGAAPGGVAASGAGAVAGAAAGAAAGGVAAAAAGVAAAGPSAVAPSAAGSTAAGAAAGAAGGAAAGAGTAAGPGRAAARSGARAASSPPAPSAPRPAPGAPAGEVRAAAAPTSARPGPVAPPAQEDDGWDLLPVEDEWDQQWDTRYDEDYAGDDDAVWGEPQPWDAEPYDPDTAWPGPASARESTVPVVPAGRGTGRRRPAGAGTGVVVVLLMGAFVVGGLVWALERFQDADDVAAPVPVVTETVAPSPEPSVAPEPSVEPEPTAGVVEVLSPAGVQALDPQGDGEENDQDAPRAIDGDPGSGWNTQRYNSQDFGGLKDGLGLVFDLGEPRVVTRVLLDAPGDDGTYEIRTANGPGFDGSTVVATGETGDGTAEIVPEAPVTTQFLLVWFTSLPDVDGDWRGVVNELQVEVQ